MVIYFYTKYTKKRRDNIEIDKDDRLRSRINTGTNFSVRPCIRFRSNQGQLNLTVIFV